MADVTLQSLLEAGVHFGHQTRRWNPKMSPYLFGERAGVHIIDLDQSLAYLKEAQTKAEEITKGGATVLFVGTKRQGKDTVRAAAERAGQPFVVERWLGGMLTNFETIRTRLKLLAQLSDEKAAGDWDHLPKKEVARKQETLDRLETVLGGVRKLDKLPGALFINDVVREDLAVAEAQKLGIPIIGVIDSNADPRGIDYPIPANDDAVKAIQLIADAIADSAQAGADMYAKTSANKPPQPEEK